jgi:PBP1b-binding outer membrane lipoprotein LpoB
MQNQINSLSQPCSQERKKLLLLSVLLTVAAMTCGGCSQEAAEAPEVKPMPADMIKKPELPARNTPQKQQ